MITFIQSFIIFSVGFLAAAVDWTSFLKQVFDFSKMRNQSWFLGGILLITALFLPVLYLANKVFENAQSKFDFDQ